MLVPFFSKGAGATELETATVGRDQVRGRYLDNTSLANWLLDTKWVASAEPAPTPTEEPTTQPTSQPTAEPTSAPSTEPSASAAPARSSQQNLPLLPSPPALPSPPTQPSPPALLSRALAQPPSHRALTPPVPMALQVAAQSLPRVCWPLPVPR